MSFSRSSRIAIVGQTCWQQTRSTDDSSTDRLAGAALTATILATWNVPVALVSLVGDDEAGELARAELATAGVDLTWLTSRPGQPTTRVTIAREEHGNETVAGIVHGPRLVRGDRLDVYAIFSNDLVVLDIDDFALRQFLVDLPAHTVPTTRLLGTSTGLVDPSQPERLRVALAHDAIVATEPEFLILTGAASLDEGVTEFRQTMRISNLRTAILLRSAATTILTPATRSDLSTTAPAPLRAFARSALLAGIAYGMAQRWPWEEAISLATTAATLVDTSAGRKEGIPSLEEISTRLRANPATLDS